MYVYNAPECYITDIIVQVLHPEKSAQTFAIKNIVNAITSHDPVKQLIRLLEL